MIEVGQAAGEQSDPALRASRGGLLNARPGDPAQRGDAGIESRDDRVQGMVGLSARLFTGAEPQPWRSGRQLIDQFVPYPALRAPL